MTQKHTLEEGEGWRMSLVVDEVTYDDSYIDTWEVSDGEKAKAKLEVWTRIDQEGVWGLYGEVACDCCDSWVHVDSIGGFIGEDWKGSGYETDVLEACKTEAAKLKADRQALVDAVAELGRLRHVLMPQYEGKVAEPDLEILERAKQVLDPWCTACDGHVWHEPGCPHKAASPGLRTCSACKGTVDAEDELIDGMCLACSDELASEYGGHFTDPKLMGYTEEED